jgi:hypothetical protein
MRFQVLKFSRLAGPESPDERKTKDDGENIKHHLGDLHNNV